MGWYEHLYSAHGWHEWIHLKSSLIAIRSVFGVPLNKLTPDLPGQMTTFDLSMANVDTIHCNFLSLLGKSIGQCGAEGHLGTTKVLTAAVFCACHRYFNWEGKNN